MSAPPRLDDPHLVGSLIADLRNKDTREEALVKLSKSREVIPDLAPLLWHAFGIMAVILQEIVTIYPLLSPPQLPLATSNRVCNALALLQCVAAHPDTRTQFLNAHIPLYLYPFLNTTITDRPFENLRVTSLGVIGALAKGDDPEVINFLLSTEVIPSALHSMEVGEEVSKSVASFILGKILMDERGLEYICTSYDRFYAVTKVLNSVVSSLDDEPSPRLIKHVTKCYLSLSENPRAREALRACLPEQFRDGTLVRAVGKDTVTKQWMLRLFMLVGPNPNALGRPPPM